jgi:hypothetical protein
MSIQEFMDCGGNEDVNTEIQITVNFIMSKLITRAGNVVEQI